MDCVQLFLKRIHRPLRPCDFARNAQTHGTILRNEAETQLLAHPLLQELGGNPSHLRDASQRVTPQLRSLFDLLGTTARPNASVPPLVRAMSVDEAPELARRMSMDEPPQSEGRLLRE